jgi:hypothetical protein
MNRNRQFRYHHQFSDCNITILRLKHYLYRKGRENTSNFNKVQIILISLEAIEENLDTIKPLLLTPPPQSFFFQLENIKKEVKKFVIALPYKLQ